MTDSIDRRRLTALMGPVEGPYQCHHPIIHRPHLVDGVSVVGLRCVLWVVGHAPIRVLDMG